MAADVKSRSSRARWICLLMAGLSFGAAGQTADTDPTRPPLQAGVDKQADAQTSGAGAVLESVLIPAQGKPLAIISGKTVYLGQKFGEDKLISVTQNEVVLRGKDGTTRLALNPSVSLKPIRPPKITAPASGRQ